MNIINWIKDNGYDRPPDINNPSMWLEVLELEEQIELLNIANSMYKDKNVNNTFEKCSQLLNYQSKIVDTIKLRLNRLKLDNEFNKVNK